MIEAFATGIGMAIGFVLTIALLLMAFAGISKQGTKPGEREDGVNTRGQGKD